MPKAEIINTTDWNETAWKDCRFYLSKGEVLMRTMDPEKDKKASFANCVLKDLSAACSTPKLAAKASASSEAAGNEAVKAADGDAGTAWKPTAAENQWLQLDFGKPIAVNEFKDGSSLILSSLILNPSRSTSSRSRKTRPPRSYATSSRFGTTRNRGG